MGVVDEALNRVRGTPRMSGAGDKAIRRLDLLWIAAAALSPFFVFPAGLPQLEDGLLALWSSVALCVGGFRFATHGNRAHLLLLSYATLVNLVWLGFAGDLTFGLSGAYALFNLVICLGAAKRLQLSLRDMRWLEWGAIVSIWAVALTLPFYYEPGEFRQALSFNKPNQLGYHCVLALSLLSLARVVNPGPHGRLLALATLAAGCMLIVLSNSKAAMLSVAPLVFLETRRSPRLMIAFAVAAVLLVGRQLQSEDSPFALAERRLQSIGEHDDDNLEGRGYDRIWLYPQYLFLGAGEGAHDRFVGSQIVGAELHSSWATVVFSYGIPGTICLVAIWLAWLRGPWSIIFCALPSLLYGLTHQGLRQPVFWVLVVAIGTASSYLRAGKRTSPSSAGRRRPEAG